MKRHIKAIGKTRSTEAIENLINKYKELLEKVSYLEEIRANQHDEIEDKEAMIKLMARFIKINTSDDGLSIRPATIEEKIEFFRKKAKGE